MKFKKGQRVIYIPTHAGGDRGHPDCELGTVVRYSTDIDTVFVLYDGDLTPKGTYACDLEDAT